MFLKGLKNMEIAWLDGDYVVWYGRIYSYPDELATLLLKHAIASIPVPSDYIEEVQFWVSGQRGAAHVSANLHDIICPP